LATEEKVGHPKKETFEFKLFYVSKPIKTKPSENTDAKRD
jgi:hypothetical protein